MSDKPEILLIDKPAGITSFDVIRRLRRELNIKKMGHAGTLDPLATGLMIIGIDSDTKKLNDYIKLDKEYVAEIRVGESRSTGDLEGEILEKKKVAENFTDQELIKISTGMIGTLRLPVSAYSAIKKEGVPMYKRARAAERKGEMVTDVPIRDMEVKEVEFLSQTIEADVLVVTIRFYVGSGTYIRSLAEEFGKRLGYPATLQSLRRTKVGDFKISDARSI